MTTLAAVSLGLVDYDGGRVHGHTLTRDELARVVAELASMSLASRRLVSGMEPKRADVIVAGHADKLKRPRIVTKTDEVFATTLLSAVVLLGACAVGGALFARAR